MMILTLCGEETTQAKMLFLSHNTQDSTLPVTASLIIIDTNLDHLEN